MSGARPPIIERAYQMADSGEAASTKALRQALRSEGYPHSEVAAALTGLAIRRSLTARIARAKDRDDADAS